MPGHWKAKKTETDFMRMELMKAVSPSILFFRHSTRPFRLFSCRVEPHLLSPMSNKSAQHRWNEINAPATDSVLIPFLHLAKLYCLKKGLFCGVFCGLEIKMYVCSYFLFFLQTYWLWFRLFLVLHRLKCDRWLMRFISSWFCPVKNVILLSFFRGFKRNTQSV